jgi:YD repeat-containing protein
MKRQLFRCGVLLLAATNLTNADPEPQPQISFTEGAGGTWNTDWSGVALRTYFIEWSLDLENWQYAPLVDFGTGLKSFGINTQGEEKFFVRLRYVDDTTVTTLQEARDADFDNDGIPNYYEVEDLFTNPLDKESAGGDSDTDELPDGWELFHFGGLGIANPNASLQPDGLTNKEKADLGLNPNTDYSDSNAAQPSKYGYDLAGRLTGVTAPLGAVTFTPDPEGNITNAH